MQEGAQISEGQNYGKDRTTASLLQGAQVVVPRDSGPAHLAAAVDTPPGVLIWVAEKHGCPQSVICLFPFEHALLERGEGAWK